MEQPLASSTGASSRKESDGKRPPLPPIPTVETVGHAESAERPAATNNHSFQDQQTLAQLRRGNWSVMEQVVSRYQDRLYLTLLRMLGHPDDAADLVQETFVRAIQAVDRFEGHSSLYTWLFRIAVNLALSHRRANRYRATVSLDGDDAEGGQVNRQAVGLQRRLAQETEADPAASAEQRMEYERLLAALAKLNTEFRAVIVLRDIEDCDYEQMAAILDVPVGTIKSRLFRARSALRKALQTAVK